MRDRSWAAIIIVGFLCITIVMGIEKSTRKTTTDPIASRIEKITEDNSLPPDIKETLIQNILQQAKKDTVYKDTCIPE